MKEGLRILCTLGRRQICIHFSVIDSQELIGSSSHIDVIWLSLRSFLFHEGKDRIIYRGTFNKTVHDLEERFSQMRRPFLRCGVAFAFVISRFIWTGIYTGKSRQSSSVIKACNISNLCNELGSKRGADTIHLHDDRVLRELRCHLIHLDPKRLHGLRCNVQHGDCLADQQFGVVILGEYRDEISGCKIDFFCLRCAEIVVLLLTPVFVVLSEDFKGFAANAIYMLIGVDKIHPFLADHMLQDFYLSA